MTFRAGVTRAGTPDHAAVQIGPDVVGTPGIDSAVYVFRKQQRDSRSNGRVGRGFVWNQEVIEYRGSESSSGARGNWISHRTNGPATAADTIQPPVSSLDDHSIGEGCDSILFTTE